MTTKVKIRHSDVHISYKFHIPKPKKKKRKKNKEKNHSGGLMHSWEHSWACVSTGKYSI